MTKGGARPNAGRPKLPDDIKRHKINFYITYEEKELIKNYIKQLREINEKI